MTPAIASAAIISFLQGIPSTSLFLVQVTMPFDCLTQVDVPASFSVKVIKTAIQQRKPAIIRNSTKNL
jgi:hypothetical protein